VERSGHLTLRKGLTDPRVLGLSFVYLTIVTATYGLTFFLPLIIKQYGLSNAATGLVTAIPYTVGAVGMMVWAHSSDRRQERRWHFIWSGVLAALGLWLAGALHQPPLALAAMSIAAIGLYGSKPCFWPIPSKFLTGSAAAGGLALVNSIGNLGGFAGPYVVGWIRDSTKSYTAGLYFLAACALASAVLAYIVVQKRTAEA
jgi:ACS family tartrate transporter-like MFS transporter